MRLFLAVLSISILTLAHTAKAQDSSEFCGLPSKTEFSTDTVAHCDIYQRQLAYREEALKLEKLMEERQENFASPRREALKRYKEDMKELNAERDSTTQ